MQQLGAQVSAGQSLDLENPLAQQLLAQLEILHSWASMHHRILERFESSKYQHFQVIMRSGRLSDVLVALIALTANSSDGRHAGSLISFSGLEKLDKLLNQIKVKTFESLNMLLEYIELLKEDQQQTSPFHHKMHALIPQLAASACLLATDERLEDCLEDEDYSELAVQVIETMCITMSNMAYKYLYEPQAKNLFVNVCLCLIKLTTQDAEMMLSDPQEFNNFSLDCCDKQQSMVPKTQACKLIEAIIDNIEGSVIFIAKFALSALNVSLTGMSPEKIYEPSFGEWQQSRFLTSDPILVAESCLVVLTCISYIVPQREDLIAPLDETITATVGAMLTKRPHGEAGMSPMDNAKAVILRSRFCLLQGYYADVLFTKDENAFKDSIQFLFESIAQQEGYDQVVAYGCIDTISIIVTDKDVTPRMHQYLDFIVKTLAELVTVAKIDIVSFYDFITDFIKINCKMLAGPPVLQLASSFVARVEHEAHQKAKGLESDRSLIVTDKCCGLLKVIVESPVLMPAMAAQIEECLQPLYRCMKEPKAVSFDDHVVGLLKLFIRKVQGVTPIMWEVFACLPNVLEKNKKQLGSLLDTVNFYMFYGKEAFASSPDSILVVARMIELAMNTGKALGDSEAAVLLQLLFQILTGTNALDSIFANLLELTVKRMQGDNMPVHLKKQLIGIFMAAMTYNATATLNFLESKQMTAQLIQEMINVKARFTLEYEMKFFIVGLSQMLLAENLPVSVRPVLVAIMNELVAMITRLNTAVGKRLFAEAAKELNPEGDSDEDYDDEDDDDEDEEE